MGLELADSAQHVEQQTASGIRRVDVLINYILDAEAGALIADYIYYATPNDAARKLLSADYNENPAIFPPADAIAKSEVSIFPGQEVLGKIDTAWTRIRAAG